MRTDDLAPAGDERDELAEKLLARFASSESAIARLERGDSNLVWATDDLVLRMSASSRSRDLIREAELSELLPEPVGYPRVLGSGVEDGREWMITERIEGEQLEIRWPTMGDENRIRALENLWDRLKWVQRTDVGKARAIGRTSTPFYALDETSAVSQLSQSSQRGAVDSQMQESLERQLERSFAAMKGVTVALNHTDAGLHNTLWTGRDAIPIDFEFACLGPVDLDLEMLLRQLLPLRSSMLSAKLAELANEHLARPGSRDRLIGYTILRDLWALLLWLRYADSYGPDRPWPPKDIEEWDPWLRLRQHAEGRSPLTEFWS